MAAESCIICLGNLSISALSAPPSPSKAHNAIEEPLAAPGTDVAVESQPGAIACILPCTHVLHNECLKPWVERANSCPICRQSFNMVELKATVDGPALSSYAVADKQQVGELDPLLVVEEEDLSDNEVVVDPCVVCNSTDHDEYLLLCDGCEASCHTYCADLDFIPAGAWYCDNCLLLGNTGPNHRHTTPSHRNIANAQRTYGEGQNGSPRRHRARVLSGDGHRLGSEEPSDSGPLTNEGYLSMWSATRQQLDFDVEFPFDDNGEIQADLEQRRQEILAWQERFLASERQGGSNAARFRDSASVLASSVGGGASLDNNPQESQDELRAWNAFDKARERQVSGRKRRSRTTTPTGSQEEAEPERVLKRPRTRRTQDFSDTGNTSAPEPSTHRGREPERRSERSSVVDSGNTAPSFLNSLIQEVVTAPNGTTDGPSSLQSANAANYTALDYSSPGESSPATSPSTSNHPSPRVRSISPPPIHSSRPQSPLLSSRIEPIFAQQPEYSPASPSIKRRPASDELDRLPQSFRSSLQSEESPTPQLPRDDSPTRYSLPFSEKEIIQKMVAALLKPAYKNRDIDSDQYTAINKQVSRSLYEQVGDAGGMKDNDNKEKWLGVAKQEVLVALEQEKEKAKGKEPAA